MKTSLLRVDEIPEQGTRTLDFFGRQIHVFKAEGKPRAIMNACMHIGGPLDYQDGRFVCAWHNAEFDGATGQRLAGPAPSSSRLMFLPTRIEDGVLMYVWNE